MAIKFRPKSVTIAIWNACILTNKQSELLEFVKRYRVDVLLVSETCHKSAKKIKLHTYNVFRAGREDGRFGGGVAIFCNYIKDHFLAKYRRIDASRLSPSLSISQKDRLRIFLRTSLQRIPCGLTINTTSL